MSKKGPDALFGSDPRLLTRLGLIVGPTDRLNASASGSGPTSPVLRFRPDPNPRAHFLLALRAIRDGEKEGAGGKEAEKTVRRYSPLVLSAAAGRLGRFGPVVSEAFEVFARKNSELGRKCACAVHAKLAASLMPMFSQNVRST